MTAGQGCIRREGGALKGGGGGWLGPPSSQGPPMVPRRRGAEHFEAEILLAPKAPKKNFGCQPQTLEGEEGGGGPGEGAPPPPEVYGRSSTSLPLGFQEFLPPRQWETDCWFCESGGCPSLCSEALLLPSASGAGDASRPRTARRGIRSFASGPGPVLPVVCQVHECTLGWLAPIGPVPKATQ